MVEQKHSHSEISDLRKVTAKKNLSEEEHVALHTLLPKYELFLM